MMDNISQIKHQINKQLRAYSKSHKIDHNFILMRYAGERLIYRMSLSRYSDIFVLKGAMLFSLWTDKLFRPTKDIDFLSYGQDSDDRLKLVFNEIASIKPDKDDGIEFDVERIQIAPIREAQAYQGKRIKIPVKDSSIVVQIDVGFGDSVTPEPSKTALPSLIADMPQSKIKVYNKETVIAEKFEAMISLGTANSRMKDFYDIWFMSEEFEFDGRDLLDAIKNTFARRKTALPVSLPEGLNKDLMLTNYKIRMWNNFVNRSNLEPAVEFSTVIDRLCEFLIVPLKFPSSNGDFTKIWINTEGWH